MPLRNVRSSEEQINATFNNGSASDTCSDPLNTSYRLSTPAASSNGITPTELCLLSFGARKD